MNVLAADRYILCCGLLRTLVLLYDDVRLTSANSIDEVLACRLPDLDLVLLDASMPGMENLAGLKRTVKKFHEVPIIVTSSSESRTQVLAAIRNGAQGYVAASCKPHVLEHALPLVMAGEFYIPASALRGDKAGVLRASDHDRAALPMTPAGHALTPRQREITVMLAEGKSNKEIARELKVLESTVKLHVRGVFRNLGVRNRTEAALAAVRAGYLAKGILSSGLSMSEYGAGDVDHKVSGASASSPPSPSEGTNKARPLTTTTGHTAPPK
jgi:two-component system, NarL family, nitrate/nitrite response regulator NarL